MSEKETNNENNNEVKVDSKSEKTSDTTPKTTSRRSFTPGSSSGERGKGGYKGRGGKVRRMQRERPKPEFDQKIISIRRVTRVMAGGRRFSFSVVMVIGDKKGRVGVGIGKAGDTSLAIQKAINNAKKNIVKLKLNDSHSINHEVATKYSTARVELRPNHGRGLVAGSAIRTVLELAGTKDVTGRVLSRSKNKLNIARATISALDPFVGARGRAVPIAPEKTDSFTAGRRHNNNK